MGLIAVGVVLREWFSRVAKLSEKYLVKLELPIKHPSKGTPQEVAISISVNATLIPDCV